LWIYSLLARLEKPLYSETAALIRSLLRRCCELRVQLANHMMEISKGTDIDNIDLCNINGVSYNVELASLNLIIVITGSYFGQAEGSFGTNTDLKSDVFVQESESSNGLREPFQDARAVDFHTEEGPDICEMSDDSY